MRISRCLVAFAFITLVALCFAQDAARSGQAIPAVSGTGQANHVAVWKNSTTLGSSGIVATGGNVGIGTTAPAAKLEVNGDAQVDGNFSLSGSIFETGVGQLLWAPNDFSGNFSAGLRTNATGSGNTATGYEAMAGNSGSYNTATGANALFYAVGHDNVALGYYAANFLESGSFNVAVGSLAGAGMLESSNNTFVGYNAGNPNNGNNNIAIGSQAGHVGNSNNIHIGHQGTATDDGTIRIGTPGTQTSAFIAGISGANVNGVPVIVSSNGQLGIASSSRRYKEDIADMADSSNGLMKLRPVTFRYKKPYEDGSKPLQYGLIAEEVAEVYPDLVARSADGQVESVRYQLLDPMLLNELQKQHATIAAQKKQISGQQQQIQDQQEQIRSLAKRLARIEAALPGSVTTSSH